MISPIGAGLKRMIKNILYLLSSFPYPFPVFLYPAAQGMYQSFRTKIQSVGISDRTA